MAPKGPQGSSCNSNQSLKSCNLGLEARVTACEEDINQAAPNKREGKRRETEEAVGEKVSLSLSSRGRLSPHTEQLFLVCLAANYRMSNGENMDRP